MFRVCLDNSGAEFMARNCLSAVHHGLNSLATDNAHVFDLCEIGKRFSAGGMAAFLLKIDLVCSQDLRD